MNALQELKEFLKENNKTFFDIKCAVIWAYNLINNYNKKDLENFLKKIKYVDYDDSFWTQELFWIIWFKDWTWADRLEYDGAEWWEYRAMPEIPDNLIFNKK
jgi:hypothetical protein